MAIRSPDRAWARARVAPQTRAYVIIRLAHGVDVGGALPVAQLAHVEVADLAVDAGDSLPAEEDVAGRLHQPLAGDHSLPVVGVLALPTNRSSTDSWASLACRNSGSWPSRPSMSTIQARVPTLPTPTTLRAAWTYSKSSSRCPPVGLEGPPVGPEQAAELRLRRLFPWSAAATVLDRDDQRRIGDDPALAIDLLGELGERLHAVPGPRLGEVLLGLGPLLLGRGRPQLARGACPPRCGSTRRRGCACRLPATSGARYSATPAVTITRPFLPA